MLVEVDEVGEGEVDEGGGMIAGEVFEEIYFIVDLRWLIRVFVIECIKKIIMVC